MGGVMTIKAIETIYKGYRFRSRLEARWAVFFDEIDIKYEYEPDGFIKGNYRYLPDFYLPETETWVEVKGLWADQDMFGFTEFLDFGCPLPGFDNSADDNDLNSILTCRGLLILGNIPHINWGIVLHPLIMHNKGLVRKYVSFGRKSIHKVESDSFGYKELGIQAYYNNYDDLLNFFDIEPHIIETEFAIGVVVDAYHAARQARFEHGQIGPPKRWRV